MSYFGSIYADREMPHRARAVYMYLRDRADAEGKCWPGLKTIAGDLNLSVATVQRALSDLEKAGYVTRTNRYRPNGGKTSNLYTLNVRNK
ncbi:MAG: helix-turn-helix domain-containing protein [Acidaminococcaceae bacterium]|nr:helix-turn-helix domain-containing protein [Acidaminococcaceae bacterium]